MIGVLHLVDWLIHTDTQVSIHDWCFTPCGLVDTHKYTGISS